VQKGITWAMTPKVLKEAMRRVESWRVEAQEELAEIALEIDAPQGRRLSRDARGT
jgi:hypothetical protein